MAASALATLIASSTCSPSTGKLASYIPSSDKRKTRNGDGPSSIAGFQRSITRKWLLEDDGNWLACDQPS